MGHNDCPNAGLDKLRAYMTGNLGFIFASNFSSDDVREAFVVLVTIESVCMITAPQECIELPANKNRANLETWACTKPRELTHPSPVLSRNISTKLESMNTEGTWYEGTWNDWEHHSPWSNQWNLPVDTQWNSPVGTTSSDPRQYGDGRGG